MSSDQLRLGYACSWWHPREHTWSYTANRLREAIEDAAAIVDIEVQRTLVGKAALRALHGPVGIPWRYSRAERWLMDRAARRKADRSHLDAVLGVGDVDTPMDLPMFLYQDMNLAIALEFQDREGGEYVNILRGRRNTLRRRADEQIERCQRAAGVFAMSQWFADVLVERYGIARDKVWVARAGMNNPPHTERPSDREPAGRVLFVGADFHRKGGDLVVEAVRRLRSSGDRQLVLTVVGPERWPMTGDLPEWVDFRGTLPPQEVSRILADHDVFVMPSRFEAFGIALIEALAAGLPCVARRAFAMPELVEDGRTGALVQSDDPDELAGALDGLLADPDVYARVGALRGEVMARYAWPSIASAMVNRICQVVG